MIIENDPLLPTRFVVTLEPDAGGYLFDYGEMLDAREDANRPLVGRKAEYRAFNDFWFHDFAVRCLTNWAAAKDLMDWLIERKADYVFQPVVGLVTIDFEDTESPTVSNHQVAIFFKDGHEAALFKLNTSHLQVA